MSAAARAKARREALLNRGTDRLAKLTTSARGEDAAHFSHDRPLAPSLTNFLGEDSPMNSTASLPSTPHRRPQRAESSSPAQPSNLSRSTSMPPSNSLAAMSAPPPMPMPTIEDFASALPPGMQLPPFFEQILAGAAAGGGGGGTGIGDDPFAALTGPGGFPGMPPLMQQQQAQMQQEPPRPRTLAQRLMPLFHLVAVIALVAYMTFAQRLHNASWEQRSTAWNSLARRRDDREVSVLPPGFFWAFLALELMLHSMRIFSRNDRVQLPGIVSFALPHLPPPIPSLILNGARYYTMLGMLLDDIAALVFALGVVVWFHGFGVA
ncbi:hypothetical protein EXIGLDRAFT_738682 [Exidia glandulosa HHB12029]|uniref:Golgi to ER traffic protein 2 n=1 Tax=Exidia glandulosa HHB12029 TaxID=1314781 RepID=A0A165NG38_EXIGL|nr:hypothetical protein EXIGLDRAFT_738682 [Exidia glandulosa HHB12029]